MSENNNIEEKKRRVGKSNELGAISLIRAKNTKFQRDVANLLDFD